MPTKRRLVKGRRTRATATGSTHSAPFPGHESVRSWLGRDLLERFTERARAAGLTSGAALRRLATDYADGVLHIPVRQWKNGRPAGTGQTERAEGQVTDARAVSGIMKGERDVRTLTDTEIEQAMMESIIKWKAPPPALEAEWRARDAAKAAQYYGRRGKRRAKEVAGPAREVRLGDEARTR